MSRFGVFNAGNVLLALADTRDAANTVADQIERDNPGTECTVREVESMTTTIQMAETRLELAREIEDWTNGNQAGGLQVRQVGAYTLVDDNHDRWIATSGEYEDAVAELIGQVLDGDWDRRITETLEEQGQLDYVPWYDELCNECDTIYSRIGTPSNVDDLRDLDCTDEQRAEILDFLGVELEVQQ